ncbi:MAG: insulinase family protein [Candidatus Shikimatogenerans sp. Tcar]|uniref:Insulinase family protein n=1 Tax=Candidatus Shikimatogenerans sp. Tcar TaxID=3158565 RepID=A0AAU7QRZ2_9FLAO
MKNIYNYNYIKYELNNGIKVILNKNINNYTISCNFFFYVGSKNDFLNCRGLANFFKYYIILYNKNFKKNIIKNGGILNSFTTYDGTYFNIIIVNKLKLILKLMSNNFKKILLNKKKILKIINCINFKKHNINNNKYYTNLIYKIIPKYLFKNHSYKNTIVGKINELKKCLLKDYKKFYKKYYNSKNMIITISGNISFNKTKKLINKYFLKFYNKNNYKYDYKVITENKLKNKLILLKNTCLNFFIGILLYRLPNILNKDINIIKFICFILINKYKNYLFNKIKKKNNNILNINLKLNIMEDYSSIYIYYIVKNKKYILKILKIINKLFNKISKKGFNKKKINMYKKLIIKKEILNNLNNYQISVNLNNYLIYYKNIKFYKKYINICKNINNNIIKTIFKKYFLNKFLILINEK